MPPFVPGLELSRSFYEEVVRPLLDAAFPGLAHSAALLGPGSEVLGFDTDRSTDHRWGPRVILFVASDRVGTLGPEVTEVLRRRLPVTFRGWSTGFAPDASGAAAPVAAAEGDVSHLVEVHAPEDWFRRTLGFDPADGVTLDDWLATPTQLLLAVTAGGVFHDGLGALASRRAALAWYPDDVWRYVLGCQWQRIAHEEAFVGRAGEVGDDLGSRLVAARVARDLVRLAFLVERRYAPTGKWLGRAFEQLDCAGEIGPHLGHALGATSWQRREAALGRAAEAMGARFNALALCEAVDTALRTPFGRPFLVLDAQRFADAAYAAIRDPAVAALARGVGAIDQWVDNTDVLASPPRTARLRRAMTGCGTGPGRQARVTT